MMVKIMSNSKKIKEKVHFYVSILAGAVQLVEMLIRLYRVLRKKIKRDLKIGYQTIPNRHRDSTYTNLSEQKYRKN